MKREIIVTLADKNYLDQAKQLFSSVYWNAGWQGDYMLLSHEVPEEELRWFTERGIIVRRCVPIRQREVGYKKHSPAILDKFYLFTPEFKRWKNVVFLDSDMIVRASLDRLKRLEGFAATHMHRRTLGEALQNYNRMDERDYERKLDGIKKEYDLGKQTFNTGIMAFSTSLIREDTFKVLLGIFDEIEDISCSNEESVLNIYFYRRWKRLPRAYNVFVNITESYGIKPEDTKGIVLHFIAENHHPWLAKSPFYDEWIGSRRRAETMDVSRRREAVSVWSGLDMLKLELYFRSKSNHAFRVFDRCLGRAGRLLRASTGIFKEDRHN